MIRPLEDRTNPGDYVNRVKRPEHDHAPGSRDFAYEIGEVSDEQSRRRQPPNDFGEDSYEHSEEDQEPPSAAPVGETNPNNEPPRSEESSLDITV